MFRTLKRIPAVRIGAVLMGACTVSALAFEPASAISANDYLYSPAKTGYLTISPMAMAPQRDDALFHPEYAITYPGTLQGFGCFQTGVNLPQGASIISVSTVYASGNQSDITIKLLRSALSNGAAANLISTTVLDNTMTRKVVTFAIPFALRTVNNPAYSYGYAVCLGLNTGFAGARIVYTYKNAGD